MTDPTPAHDSVAALALALLMSAMGPLLGQVMLILACSFIGALISLSRARTESLWPHGVMVLGRGMGLAVMVGGIGSVLWARMLGDSMPYAESLAAVSWLVGLRTEWALERIAALTGGSNT